MKPAMTEQEWEDARDIGAAGAFDYYGAQACAAVCLDGEPFGFTREMAEAMAEALSSSECDVEMGRLAADGIDRIEALLPPEKT